MRYTIRALTAENAIALHAVEATDEADARRQGRELRLRVLSVNARSGQVPLLHRRTAGFSLVLFSQELLALLHAGLSLTESIDALGEKEAVDSRHSIVTRLAGALREGARFSNALAQFPDYFPPLYRGLIEAAEGTSDLPLALKRFIDYQSRIDTIRAKIVSAAIYPIILLAVGSVVTLFLIGYVVPKFATIYKGTGRSLPWLSTWLLRWGELFSSHPLVLGAVLFALVALAIGGIRHVVQRGGWPRLVAALPGVGRRLAVYELARLYLTLGTLVEGGISIINALTTSARVLPPALRDPVHRARLRIESGEPLSAAFEAERLTTPISARMLRVGERTGELGSMLTQAAQFYDGDIGRFIERFTKSFEPLLMVAIGGIVGLIVVLLYLPIFDLAGSIQ